MRWLAHIGIIKRLVEHKYHIWAISGSSAGAVIGLCVCAGIPINEIIDILTQVKLRDLLKFDINKSGLMSLDNIANLISQYIKIDRIENLPIPLYVSTTSLTTWLNMIRHTGDVIPIIKWSCSIPVSFQTIKYDHHILVDGGVTNNFPIEPFLDKRDLYRWNDGTQTEPYLWRSHASHNIIIWIDVNPYKWIRNNKITEIVPKSISLSVQQAFIYKRHLCDHWIQPSKLQSIKLFDTINPAYIINIGYQEAQKKRWNTGIL